MRDWAWNVFTLVCMHICLCVGANACGCVMRMLPALLAASPAHYPCPLLRLPNACAGSQVGAQCAHAAVGVLWSHYNSHNVAIRQWEMYGQPKIALKVGQGRGVVRVGVGVGDVIAKLPECHAQLRGLEANGTCNGSA